MHLGLGIEVVLLPPYYVGPYRQRNETDSADAEALLLALRDSRIQPATVKSLEQQALTALHRVRSPAGWYPHPPPCVVSSSSSASLCPQVPVIFPLISLRRSRRPGVARSSTSPSSTSPSLPERLVRPGEKGGDGVGLTKRGKGTKWMLVVDGNGIPIGFHLEDANKAEVRLAEETLRSVRVHRSRRGRPRTRPQVLTADRAYDSRAFRVSQAARGSCVHPSTTTPCRLETATRPSCDCFEGGVCVQVDRGAHVHLARQLSATPHSLGAPPGRLPGLLRIRPCSALPTVILGLSAAHDPVLGSVFSRGKHAALLYRTSLFCSSVRNGAS